MRSTMIGEQCAIVALLITPLRLGPRVTYGASSRKLRTNENHPFASRGGGGVGGSVTFGDSGARVVPRDRLRLPRLTPVPVYGGLIIGCKSGRGRERARR